MSGPPRPLPGVPAVSGEEWDAIRVGSDSWRREGYRVAAPAPCLLSFFRAMRKLPLLTGREPLPRPHRPAHRPPRGPAGDPGLLAHDPPPRADAIMSPWTPAGGMQIEKDKHRRCVCPAPGVRGRRDPSARQLFSGSPNRDSRPTRSIG